MKILSLDGGGCFGIAQAKILEQSDLRKFDVYVGTSIGAANAAVCATGKLKGSMSSFFYEEMPKIFKGYWWRKFLPFAPKYNDKQLKKSLIMLFGDMKLGDSPKDLYITTVDLVTKKLKVFNSNDPIDAERPLWEVVRAAVAAETYFNPYGTHADAGVVANDPSMVAVAAACRDLGCKVSDIELCSIGTGTVPTPTKSSLRRYSLLSWGIWLIKALLNGAASSMHQYFVKSLPLKKYVRIEFVRDADWDMDSVKDMYKAEKAWELSIQNGILTINRF